jgi:hypothetical protein
MSEHEHLPFYEHMKSLDFKMSLARERTERIRQQVALAQAHAAMLMPKSRGRGPRERRLAYWSDEVRACSGEVQ